MEWAGLPPKGAVTGRLTVSNTDSMLVTMTLIGRCHIHPLVATLIGNGDILSPFVIQYRYRRYHLKSVHTFSIGLAYRVLHSLPLILTLARPDLWTKP